VLPGDLRVVSRESVVSRQLELPAPPTLNSSTCGIVTVQHFARARIEDEAPGRQPLTSQLIRIVQPGVALCAFPSAVTLVVSRRDKWACRRVCGS